MAIGLITYDDAVRREDLIDVVTNVSPSKTPLLSGLRRGPDAKNTLHEYATDTFAAATDNAAVEAAGFTAVDLTQPSRANNKTQIFKDDILVSDTEVAVNGVVNAWQYQMEKGLVEHAKDIELAFMAGTAASGASGVARRLTGVIAALTTNATTQASAQTLTETGFNDLLELIYAGTNEFPDTAFVGGKLKRTISGFVGGSTKNVDADAKRLTNSVDIYESDFGVQKIMLHRDVANAASGRDLVLMNMGYHYISYLRPTKVEKLAKDGDRERATIVTEVTLEHRGEKTGAVSKRYNS